MATPAPAERVSGEIVEPRTATPLTTTEARQLTDRAIRLANELWRVLLRLYEGEAWRALGYPSWPAYYAAEFGQKASAAYKMIRAAREEAEASVRADTTEMTKAQALVLSATKDPQLKAALVDAVIERGGWKEVPAAEMTRIRSRLRQPRIEVTLHDGTTVTAWDARAYDEAGKTLGRIEDALRQIARVNRLGHWLSADAIAGLSPEDAAAMRERIAYGRAVVAATRRRTEVLLEELDRIRLALDDRPDLPRPSGAAGSWAEFDQRVQRLVLDIDPQQITLRDATEREGDE